MKSLTRLIPILSLFLLVAPRSPSAAPAVVPAPIDLKTLGGRQGTSTAVTVNDALQVGGLVDTLTYAHAMIWTCAGGVQDLGAPDATTSEIVSINKFGQAAGMLDGFSTPRAFFWSPQTGFVLLGTLGGGYSTAVAINDNGTITGDSQTATGDVHAYRWTRTGGMKDLGTLGGTNSSAKAINNHDVVVGSATTAQNAQQHAFSFDKKIKDLGTLGGLSAEAKAVNDNGVVVGESLLANGYTHGFYYDRSMIDIGSFFVDPNGGSWSSAVAINLSGQVTGSSSSPLGGIRPFVWKLGSPMTDLGTLGGLDAQAAAINNAGQIVGTSYLAGDQMTHPFIWTAAGGLRDLGSLGLNANAVAISPAGYVVGEYTREGGDNHGYVYGPNGLTDIPCLGRGSSSASALNVKGEVVGQSFTTAGYFRAFYWKSGAPMREIGPSGAVYTNAIAINSASQVAVVSSPIYWTPTTDLARAYLWTAATNTLQDIGNLGGRFTGAKAMNNLGQIVGVTGTADGGQSAYIWSASAGMKPLGTTSVADMDPVAINDEGVVVGTYVLPSRIAGHAFAWKATYNNGQMVDLGTLGGDSSWGVAINPNGVITGYSTTATGAVHVFKVAKIGAKMTDLGGMPGDSAQATAINAGGQVTGFGSLPNGVASHAFLSNGTKLVDLGTLGGQNSQGMAVNDGGRVVGISDTPSDEGVPYHAFVATISGGMTDLGTLGGRNSQPVGINKVNQVAGSADTADGETHAVLWNLP